MFSRQRHSAREIRFASATEVACLNSSRGTNQRYSTNMVTSLFIKHWQYSDTESQACVLLMLQEFTNLMIQWSIHTHALMRWSINPFTVLIILRDMGCQWTLKISRFRWINSSESVRNLLEQMLFKQINTRIFQKNDNLFHRENNLGINNYTFIEITLLLLRKIITNKPIYDLWGLFADHNHKSAYCLWFCRITIDGFHGHGGREGIVGQNRKFAWCYSCLQEQWTDLGRNQCWSFTNFCP